MNCLVKHDNLRQRDELFAIGQASRTLEIEDHEKGDLDNSTFYISTKTEFGQWSRETTAVLEPPALLGFGAMLGIGLQLEHLFPTGTNFRLYTTPNGSANVRIGAVDNIVTVEALASGLPGREEEGLWVLTLESCPEILQSPALRAIQDPKVLLAAAEYTTHIAERAISQ
jgi:hypothetical protein